MHEVTVFSPHRDDAIFSLYVCLARWHEASVRISVLNFFTQSAHAPCAINGSAFPVSYARSREDRRALAMIDRRIAVKSLGLLDAPLRLGIDSMSVCSSEAFERDGGSSAGKLGILLDGRIGRRELFLAPLGLGNHVDHLSVRNAALEDIKASQLAFYEDLPYATWTSKDSLREQVAACEQKIGRSLQPVVVRGRAVILRKRRAVARYQSQIRPDEAAAIARFAAKYGGGERLWIPRHGRWASFLDRNA
jgi:LmbE family N-acetylglucosaminyl deacetylase